MRRFLGKLYVQVLIGVFAGVALGFFAPNLGSDLKPLGDIFIKLIKMVFAPIIFAMVVLGIARMESMKELGRVGVRALIYFEVLSTFALGLGLLLGIERERKRDAELFFGGVRTFALIALLGAVGAFMERELNQGWLIIAAFVALSALVIVSYATTAARGELGITTEISAMLAFIVGALCGWQHVGVASVATVVCLLLLPSRISCIV